MNKIILIAAFILGSANAFASYNIKLEFTPPKEIRISPRVLLINAPYWSDETFKKAIFVYIGNTRVRLFRASIKQTANNGEWQLLFTSANGCYEYSGKPSFNAAQNNAATRCPYDVLFSVDRYSKLQTIDGASLPVGKTPNVYIPYLFGIAIGVRMVGD